MSRPTRGEPGRSVAATASILVGLLGIAPPPQARADCRVLEPDPDRRGSFSKRLSGDCTQADRRAHAVTASELLEAMRAGRPIDLANVLVTGDLSLDALPTVSAEEAMRGEASGLRAELGAAPAGPLRVVRGGLSIAGSRVAGRLVTALREGHLVFHGAVTLDGTTFERVVDLSHGVFSAPLSLAGATFLGDAYFVQARFLDQARFERVSFAQRARFHRARFRGPAVFDGARFNGMAELLEVQFDEGARFVQARFRLGTGFSGSRFGGRGDFTRARFEREGFFLHARFEADARFEDASFLSLADFSHAEFLGAQDFSGAVFEKEPRFVDTVSPGRARPARPLVDPLILYAAAALLVALTVVVLWTRRRRG